MPLKILKLQVSTKYCFKIIKILCLVKLRYFKCKTKDFSAEQKLEN